MDEHMDERMDEPVALSSPWQIPLKVPESMPPLLPKKLTLQDLGPTCRCLPCCCKTGEGHKHPEYERVWAEWWATMQKKDDE